MYGRLKMKSFFAAILFLLLSANIYAQNINCISALENVLKDSGDVDIKNQNMLTGAIALEKRGILNESINLEVLSLYVYGISAHALGLGNQVFLKKYTNNRMSNAKDIDELILNHARTYYSALKQTKERFDNEIPVIKNNNIRDDARMVRDAIGILLKKYKACEV